MSSFHHRPFDAADRAFIARSPAGVDCVADVRRFPCSRRHPHFNGEALARSLADAGILYRPFPGAAAAAARARRDGPSPHTLWREPAFRNYADYAETPEFRAGLRRAAAIWRDERAVAIMCAEAVWWRCHRRIIADYLLAAGIAVDAHPRRQDRAGTAHAGGGDAPRRQHALRAPSLF